MNGECKSEGCICYSDWTGNLCSIETLSIGNGQNYLIALDAGVFSYGVYNNIQTTSCVIQKQSPVLYVYKRLENDG
jgi:hypothetical protein